LGADRQTLRTISLPRLVFTTVVLFSVLFLPVAEAQQASDLAGAAVDPLKQSPGRIVVLVFVRTDCPLSNRYAPLIQELSVKYARESSFWLVFPDKSKSPEEIRSYLKEYGYKLSALRDPERVLVKKSGVKVTPEVAVFNAKRELVYHGRIDNLYEDFGRSRRAATTHELADSIEAASKGLPPPIISADGVGCFISDLQ
jgi:thiol-disulfide isomerase/thioredoxin